VTAALTSSTLALIVALVVLILCLSGRGSLHL
jgi:hypothetical protein